MIENHKKEKAIYYLLKNHFGNYLSNFSFVFRPFVDGVHPAVTLQSLKGKMLYLDGVSLSIADIYLFNHVWNIQTLWSLFLSAFPAASAIYTKMSEIQNMQVYTTW